MKLQELLKLLCTEMSVSGSEYSAKQMLTDHFGIFFDECIETPLGSLLFIRRCGRPNAPKLMVDTHFDEVGMLVSEILPDGFLRVTNIGGLDVKAMQAGDVIIHGKEPIFGVIASTPPHLKGAKDREKAPKIGELLIDTGYDDAALERLIHIGSPVGFAPRFTELSGNCLCSKGLDNKASCAAALYSAIQPNMQLCFDLYLCLSAREELGGAGACSAAHIVCPDLALILDTGFARAPDCPELPSHTPKLGEGLTLSVTSSNQRLLTTCIHTLAKQAGIPLCKIAEPERTGTNADLLTLTNGGIPTATVGIPILNMHTDAEIVCTDDILAAADLLSALYADEKLSEVYAHV